MNRGVYEAVCTRLKHKLAWLAYTGLQKGQFDVPARPTPTPAILIGYNPVVWEPLSQGAQSAPVVVSVYLYLDLPTGAQEEAKTLEMLDRCEEVFQALEGLTGTTFQRLTRVGEAVHQFGNHWAAMKIDFSTCLFSQKHQNTQQVTVSELTVNKGA